MRGFSAPEIGWITGFALCARLIFGPFVAIWADQQADDRRALRIVALIFALSAVGLCLELGKVQIWICASSVLWAFGMLVPLIDNAALKADRAGHLHYGQTRAVGSFSFVATTLIGGALLAQFGLDWSVAIMAMAAVATFLFSLGLPSYPNEQNASAQMWRDAPALMTDPRFILLILAAGFTQGSHAVYYAFSILHWTDLGYSTRLIGFLWTVGVLAEIMLLTRARSLAKRLSPAVMIGIGGLAATIRWPLTAMEPAIGLLIVIQLLHAFTFAAAFLGGIEFIDRAIPTRLTNTAMTLMSVTGVGALTGIATVVSGYIFSSAGINIAYFAMSGMGVMSVVLSFALARRWRGEKIL